MNSAAFAQDSESGATDQPQQAQQQDMLSNPHNAGKVEFAVSGPFALIDGDVYLGGFVDALYNLNGMISVGLESGFLIHSETIGTAWNIPILPTVVYRLNVDGTPLTPFVGASIGPGITHAALSIGSLSASATKVYLEAYGQVGATWGESGGPFAVVRVGLLDEFFLVAPSVGFQF